MKKEIIKQIKEKIEQMENIKFDRDILNTAKENNIVIIYGSDKDYLIFEGAVCDEVNVHNKEVVYIDKIGDVYNLILEKYLGTLDQELENIPPYLVCELLKEYFRKLIKLEATYENGWNFIVQAPEGYILNYSNFAFNNYKGLILDLDMYDENIIQKELDLELLKNKLEKLDSNINFFAEKKYGYSIYTISFDRLFHIIFFYSEINMENIDIYNIHPSNALDFYNIDKANYVLDFIKNNKSEIIQAIKDSIKEVNND
ncbi:MAG TPA: hypothetical protein K8V77_01830 [Brachyspira hyodysenteriae]|nr:hypothetical protein [Brachyspira hyodysenteriae]